MKFVPSRYIRTSHSQKLIIIGTYRPPNRDVSYQQELCDCICEIVRKHPALVYTGDLNLPDIDWSIANESITSQLQMSRGYKYFCFKYVCWLLFHSVSRLSHSWIKYFGCCVHKSPITYWLLLWYSWHKWPRCCPDLISYYISSTGHTET